MTLNRQQSVEDNIADFREKLLKVNLLEDKFKVLCGAISELGFDGVLYSFYPKPMYISDKMQPVIKASESYKDFLLYYQEQELYKHDFILRLASQGVNKPIDWWQTADSGLISVEERQVLIKARDMFNIHFGISFPALFLPHATAGISVISQQADSSYFQSLVDKHSENLMLYAREFHLQVMRTNEKVGFVVPLLAALTDKEKDIIRHLLTGRPLTSISESIFTSIKYAEKVAINLRNKFGGISTSELLFILGMLNINEYL